MGRKKLPWAREYKTETELCAAFIEAARCYGFKIYPETAGFDLLLIAGEETDRHGIAPGTQIGVEAKLKPNLAVIYQALPRSPMADGPDHYAVLVPYAPREYLELLSRLKIGLIHPALFEMKRFFKAFRFRHEHAKRCWVPDCEVPEMAAGIRAPVQLTPWKFASIKLGLLGMERGYLTSHDFKEAGVSIQRWRACGWIEPDGKIVSNGRKVTRFLVMEDKNPPHMRYHAVTEALQKEKACTALAAASPSPRPPRASGTRGS